MIMCVRVCVCTYACVSMDFHYQGSLMSKMWATGKQLNDGVMETPLPCVNFLQIRGGS